MDKIQKFLRSLNGKEREALLLLREQLKVDHRRVPGIKALKGMKGWFRVRIGQYRIIFTIDPVTKEVDVQRISRRSEDTYKRLD